jgi:N-acetylmuramoyl-L-alanine amidase
MKFLRIFTILTVILLNGLSSDALQIVYPKQVLSQINAGSTFFIGNTDPKAVLTINSKPVKVWENGSFVEVVPLVDGENIIKIESINGWEHETATYIIKKAPQSQTVAKEPPTELFKENDYLYATIISDNTPLRAAPNDNAKRLTHLSKGTVLMVNGKKGNYYMVSLSQNLNAWVKVENVMNYSLINGKMIANSEEITVSSDRLYDYIETPMSFPVPYKITETDNGLMFEIYNVKKEKDYKKKYKTSKNIESFTAHTTATENMATYFVELHGKLWGYEAYYEDKTLVLKIRKAPNIDKNNPLKGITITIDPGHGGSESGVIGPTCVKEKDINLDISKRLQKILEEEGANVVMTRTTDTFYGLYERPAIAKDADALILLSIHANSLPDGFDPYKKHGTSTYYYNEESKCLAETIKAQMIEDLGTKDDGVHNCSFVLTRPTMPLSVLIETAYMIHPEDYALLLDDSFRQKTAESIAKSLKSFMLF